MIVPPWGGNNQRVKFLGLLYFLAVIWCVFIISKRLGVGGLRRVLSGWEMEDGSGSFVTGPHSYPSDTILNAFEMLLHWPFDFSEFPPLPQCRGLK